MYLYVLDNIQIWSRNEPQSNIFNECIFVSYVMKLMDWADSICQFTNQTIVSKTLINFWVKLLIWSQFVKIYHEEI